MRGSSESLRTISKSIDLALARGRFLEPSDIESRSNVCVIGEGVFDQTLSRRIRFGQIDPGWKQSFLSCCRSHVIQNSFGGHRLEFGSQDLNYDIVIPLTATEVIGDILQKRQQGSFSRQRLELSQVTIEVANRFQVKSTAKGLESLLAKNHPNVDYSITVPLDLMEQAQATQRIFNFVLGSTAAISFWWVGRDYEYHAG